MREFWDGIVQAARFTKGGVGNVLDMPLPHFMRLSAACARVAEAEAQR